MWMLSLQSAALVLFDAKFLPLETSLRTCLPSLKALRIHLTVCETILQDQEAAAPNLRIQVIMLRSQPGCAGIDQTLPCTQDSLHRTSQISLATQLLLSFIALWLDFRFCILYSSPLVHFPTPLLLELSLWSTSSWPSSWL